jgi:hypothetical protein
MGRKSRRPGPAAISFSKAASTASSVMEPGFDDGAVLFEIEDPSDPLVGIRGEDKADMSGVNIGLSVEGEFGSTYPSSPPLYI